MSEHLRQLHRELRIDYGTLNEELMEQKLAVEFIPSNACVLEIGGNIGRNSCVIARLLDDSANLVVVESDPVLASKNRHNRDLNNLTYKIEAAAISQHPMIQHSWDTRYHDMEKPIPEGWKPIATITWSGLKAKYGIRFDTLVLDCEGAFYYILQEEPNFLDGFNLVQIENDFHDLAHKEFVDDVFKKEGFECICRKPLDCPGVLCNERFYEVWKRV